MLCNSRSLFGSLVHFQLMYGHTKERVVGWRNNYFAAGQRSATAETLIIAPAAFFWPPRFRRLPKIISASYNLSAM